jgi:predicted O-methyltransferase YrrM
LEAEQIFLSQVSLLNALVQAANPKVVLELGTFMGYSTTALATALHESGGGSIVTVDRNKDLTDKAAALVPTSPSVRVNFVVADAAAACLDLARDNASFDLIFLDIAEIEYPRLIPLCVELLKDRGLLIVDNVLMATVAGWKDGSNVLESESAVAHSLRTAVDLLMTDQRLTCAIVPLGSGFAICTKRAHHD